jgi:D-2-hydroxyacid dehydrogenase (NADP+)
VPEEWNIPATRPPGLVIPALLRMMAPNRASPLAPHPTKGPAMSISVVLHPKLPEGVREYVSALPGLQIVTPQDDEGVARALQDGGEVLVSFIWNESYLSPSLKWVASPSAGFDQFPVAELHARDVVITTGAGVHADAVAEHAFALMLALTRNLGTAARNMAEAKWQRPLCDEVFGKKIAIVGIGRIGDAFARRLDGWGAEVVGVKRNPATYSGPVEVIHPVSALREVCNWADILILTSPAQVDGSALIGAAELEALGAGWIVNIGRGSLIDETALIAALDSGKLRGAGLDVFSKEPLPADSPLWTSPKVLISPHVAGSTPAFGKRYVKVFETNLAAYRGQGEWMNLLGRDIPL